MLARIRDQIIVCDEEATMAHVKAILAPDPRTKREYQRLERHWRQLGETLKFATMISAQLEWSSHRHGRPS